MKIHSLSEKETGGRGKKLSFCESCFTCIKEENFKKHAKICSQKDDRPGDIKPIPCSYTCEYV